jgi:hypothetical protein
VLRADERAPAGQSGDGPREDAPDGEPLTMYQKLAAECWRAQGESPERLFKAHRNSIFGSRALAYHFLDAGTLNETARDLAHQLNDGQQYRLANELFSRLKAAGQLPRASLLAYSSSHSEAHPDLAGAEQAIALVEEAFKDVEHEFAGSPDSADAIAATRHATIGWPHSTNGGGASAVTHRTWIEPSPPLTTRYGTTIERVCWAC